MSGSEVAGGLDRSGATRVAVISLGVAVALAVAKLLVGFLGGSLGVLSDGLHSSLDAGATALTLFAVHLAVKPADRKHPFGHGRVENLSALAESALLILLGAVIGFEAILRLRDRVEVDPAWYTVVLMAVSIVVDLSRSATLRRAARKYHSEALEADALNFTADFFGSSAVLIGVIAARAGAWYADPLAALVVVLLAWVMGGRLVARSVSVLMDQAAPSDVEDLVRSTALGVNGVLGAGPIRTRQSGPVTQAEVTVQVGRTRSVEDSHAIADAVDDALGHALPGIHTLVHVEPGVESGDVVERTFAAANRLGLADQVHNVMAIRDPEGLWLTLHAKVAPDTRLDAAHRVSDMLERELRREIPDLARVEIHLEPREPQEFEGRVVTTAMPELVEAARALAETHQPILRCHEVAVSEVGHDLHAILHCEATPDRTVEEIHAASLKIEDELHRQFPRLRTVTVHFEPSDVTRLR